MTWKAHYFRSKRRLVLILAIILAICSLIFSFLYIELIHQMEPENRAILLNDAEPDLVYDTKDTLEHFTVTKQNSVRDELNHESDEQPAENFKGYNLQIPNSLDQSPHGSKLHGQSSQGQITPNKADFQLVHENVQNLETRLPAASPSKGGLASKHWSQYTNRELSYIPITIFDEHNDALFFWSLFNVTKMHLLHIDSHSDGFLPSKLIPSKESMSNVGKSSFLKNIVEYSNISDFIPIAQYFDMLEGSVIWISSAWKNIKDYNLQHGNTYVSTLGRDSNQNFCLYRSLGNQENSLEAFIHSPQGTCQSESSLKWHTDIQWHVTTMEEAMDIIKVHWPKISFPTRGKPLPYVVDIDLDYFAASEPTLLLFLPNFYPIGTLLQLLKDALAPLLCFEAPTPLDSRKTIVSQWINSFLNPFSNQKDFSTEALSSLFSLKYKPKRDQKVLQLLSSCKSSLSKENRSQIAAQQASMKQISRIKAILTLFISKLDYIQLHLLNQYHFFTFDCETNFLYGVCLNGDPSQIPSEQAIRKKITKLSQLLQEIGHPPYMVTIARSQDGYCPKHLCPLIENLLIEALQKYTFSKPTKLFYKPHMIPESTISIDVAKQMAKKEPFPKSDSIRLEEEIRTLLQDTTKKISSIAKEVELKWQIVQLLSRIERKNGVGVDMIAHKFEKILQLKKKYWEQKNREYDEELHKKLDNAAQSTISYARSNLSLSKRKNENISFESIIKEFEKY